jgi:hypothetical protein
VESARNPRPSCVAGWRDGLKDAETMHRGYKAPLKEQFDLTYNFRAFETYQALLVAYFISFMQRLSTKK